MSAKEAARIRGDKIRDEAQKFAANTLPLITSIQKAGIKSLSGIATARGTSWYASSVKNILTHQANAN